MNKKGFTLIELLAIIVILAVIMAIAIPQVLNVVSDSKNSGWKNNIKMIVKSIELNTQLYNPETGEYKYTVDGLCENPTKVNELSKSSDTKITCSNRIFYLEGIGQFAGKIDSIDCSSGICTQVPEPASFATDSWQTIVANVKNGKASAYAPTANGKDNQVLREVDLGSLGKHYLRVANTTPCTGELESETACGFVIEFADIITSMQISLNDSNAGGYPKSEIFSYVTNRVYNALPQEIKNIIIPTTVVSNHSKNDICANCDGRDENSNYVLPQQALYLLSLHEVSGLSSSTESRILDYYSLNNTDDDRIKKYAENNLYWCLRSVTPDSTEYIHTVHTSGKTSSFKINAYCGVSPAFRIG